MIHTDFHIHTSLSADSESPMESMVEQGIRLGLKTMCFTEHMDYEYPGNDISFEVDTDAYYRKYLECRERYADKIELLFGIEIGLETCFAERTNAYLNAWLFDFIIGSSHQVDRRDPYYPEFYEGREEEACYRRYFETIVENLDAISNIDVYGHLDYVVRYGPNKAKFYTYEKYKDLIDAGLRKIIEKGIGLEVNTAGFKYGLGFPNPHPDIIKRYRELGGEIISIGSDGHTPETLAYDFEKVKPLLEECGFRYYTIFRGRKPEFIKL